MNSNNEDETTDELNESGFFRTGDSNKETEESMIECGVNNNNGLSKIKKGPSGTTDLRCRSRDVSPMIKSIIYFLNDIGRG